MNRWVMAALACALLVGCGKEEPQAPTASELGKAADQAKSDSASTLEKAKQDAAAAVEQVKETTAETVEKVKEGTAEAVEKVKEEAAEAVDAAKQQLDSAQTAPATDAADTQSKAQGLLKQLNDAIAGGDTDLAQKLLAQLDAMKDSLSPSLKEQLEAARTALQAKQGGGLGGIKLPN